MDSEQASTAHSENPSADQAAAEPSRGEDRSALSRLMLRLWWRRRFLVNKRKQLRAALLIVGLVAALLVSINVLTHTVRTLETETVAEAAPGLMETMSQYDRDEMLLGILASVVVLAGVFVLTIFETHRTAGAAINVGRQLSRVADGRYDSRLDLRKGDNLRDLEEPFNRMTQTLRDRAGEDARTLERLADAVERSNGNDTAEIAAELRAMAASKRELTE
jgi:methyl-accepting chemotaxis protein